MNENLTPLRPAIKSQSAPNSPSNETETKIVGRRVNFPADDMLVTGYLEPPNPWEKALNSTPDELADAYRAACDKHQIKPLNKLLTQLEGVNAMGEREEILSLKGEKLDSKQYEAMEEIFKRIQFNTIDVESTNLDDEGSVALFDMIEYYESASNLNISSNRSMTARGWQACARMLKKTKCLESLTAQNTSINEQVMQLLCKTLRSGSYLTVLHLENSNLSGRSCTFLMQALKLNTSLKELYLAENKLTATDALQIGNLFRSNTKLELLDLRNNYIQDTGVAHIVHGLNDQALGPEGGLKTLILISNQLTFHTGMHLAKIMVSTKTLETLNIGNNNITNEGIFHLKEALMKNRTLYQLGLQATRITCEGAVALAEYIADNPHIQHVDLLENNIKVAGLLALSLSMKVNQSITRLDIDKDYKKESKKELQEQHQKLLLEIMECCERNHQVAEKLKKEEEEALRQKQESSEEPDVKFSESVSRLLSLWDTTDISPGVNNISNNSVSAVKNSIPNIHNLQTKTWGKNNIMKSSSSLNITCQSPSISNSSSSSSSSSMLPVTSTPVIVLPAEEKLRSAKTNDGNQQILKSSSINPALLSPPAAHPSPPKSRFRVSRVLDSDSLPSSAGHTPMPSPVPSPGHTPMPSPGSTPLSSPVPSPIGSPVTSPHHSPTAIGIIAPPSSPVKLKKGIINTGFDRKSQFNKITCFSPGCLAAAGCSLHSSVKFSKDKASENSEMFSCSTPSSPSVDTTTGNYAPPSSPVIQQSYKDDTYNLNDGVSSSKLDFHTLSKDSESCSPPTDSFVILGSTPPPNTPFELDSEINDNNLGPNSSLENVRFSSKPASCKSLSWTDSLNDNDYSYNSGSSSPSCMSDSCMNLSYWSTESEKSSIPKLSVHVCKNDCTCCDVSGSLPSLELNSSESSPIPASQNSQDLWTSDYQHGFPIHSDITSSSMSFVHTSSSSCAESDSFVSADSGLATPDSEISGDHSTISFSSHSENGELPFSVNNLNTLVDAGAPGSLAPPSTPIDLEGSCSNSYSSNSLSSLNNKSHIDGVSTYKTSEESVLALNPETLPNASVLNVTENIKQVSNADVYSNLQLSGRPLQIILEKVPPKPVFMNLDEPKSSAEVMDKIEENRLENISSSALQLSGPSRSVSDSNLKDNLTSLALDKSSNTSKYSSNRKSDSSLATQNNFTGNKIRMIRLAEPSCVRLFGGGLPTQTTLNHSTSVKEAVLESSPIQTSISKRNLSKEIPGCLDSVSQISPSISTENLSSEHTPLSSKKEETSRLHKRLAEEDCNSDSVGTSKIEINPSNLAKKPDNIDLPVVSSQEVSRNNKAVIQPEMNKCHEMNKNIIESAQRVIVQNNRRASTGSFPKALMNKRRISFAVDELIQKQLIELDNSSKKMKARKEEHSNTSSSSQMFFGKTDLDSSRRIEDCIVNVRNETQLFTDSQINNCSKEATVYFKAGKCEEEKDYHQIHEEHNSDNVLHEQLNDNSVSLSKNFSIDNASIFHLKENSKEPHKMNIDEYNTDSITVCGEIGIDKLAKQYQEKIGNCCSQSECINRPNSTRELLPETITRDIKQCFPDSIFDVSVHDVELQQTEKAQEVHNNSAITLCLPMCDSSSFNRNSKTTDVNNCDNENQLIKCDTINVDPSKKDYSSFKHTPSSSSSSSSSTTPPSLQQWFHSDLLDNATLITMNSNVNHPSIPFMENIQGIDLQCNSVPSEINLPSTSTSTTLLEEDDASLSNYTNRISGSNSESASEVLKTQKV